MSEQRRLTDPEASEDRSDPTTGDGQDDPAAGERSGTTPVPAEPQGVTVTGRMAAGLLGGTILIGLAIVAVVDPALLPTFDLVRLVAIGVGLVGAYLGGRSAFRYLRDGPVQVDPPLVEYRSTIEVPGEEIDASLLGGVGRYQQVEVGTSILFRSRSWIVERLWELSSTVLERTGVDPEETAALLHEGRWTDDRYASAFFRSFDPLSWSEQIRLRVRGDTAFRREARGVVDVLARRLAITEREWDDPEEWGDVGAADEGHVGTVTDLAVRDRKSQRWRIVGALSLLGLGAGVLFQSPGLLLAAAVGAGMLAYGLVGTAPTPQLAVERRLGASEPAPGEEVAVTVRVENDGDAPLFDIRLIDGVPGSLSVLDGTPRCGTALQPGASVTFSYTVEADRGNHRFDPLAVIARDPSGGVERTTHADVDGDETLSCAPRPTRELSVPVRSKTTRNAGRVVTDIGGSGLEFHSVREYRNGDPLNRIDWNRAARGEGLATLQFRVERSATVVLLVDTRVEAFVATDREAPGAVERSLGAAADVFVGLLDGDDRVGLASVGPEQCWLPPGGGQGHWARARQLLAGHEGFTRPDPDAEFGLSIAVTQLRKRLPSDAQLVLFSPLADDAAVELARRLHVYDYPMTVVSPEETGTESPGRTVAHLERRLRLSRLREDDVRVVDWQDDEPLEAATERARRRWSR